MLRTFSTTLELEVGNKQIFCEAIFSYSYDPGVRYYNDGSGCPPGEELQLLKILVSQISMFDLTINNKWLRTSGWEELADKIVIKYINDMLDDDKCGFYDDICERITNAT